MGASDERLGEIERGDYDHIPPAWAAALRFADAITPTGGRADARLFETLARHWSSAEIVEITCVITLFNYFNRFAEALEIPVTR